jgi:acyl-CoA thioester hydrolase
MGYEVVGDNGVVHAKVKTVQVAVSMETKKSRPLTDSEREFLNEYLKA